MCSKSCATVFCTTKLFVWEILEAQFIDKVLEESCENLTGVVTYKEAPTIISVCRVSLSFEQVNNSATSPLRGGILPLRNGGKNVVQATCNAVSASLQDFRLDTIQTLYPSPSRVPQYVE